MKDVFPFVDELGFANILHNSFPHSGLKAVVASQHGRRQLFWPRNAFGTQNERADGTANLQVSLA